MVASTARIEANRRNSRLSTGPRTAEGKASSRANALKHALTARVLRTEEEVAAIGEPLDPPVGTSEPSAIDRAWLRQEAALLTLRIERAARMEQRLVDRDSLLASTSWEEERRAEVEAIGANLARRPSEVASRLELSPQGCEWKIGRWAMLIRVAEAEGGWDEAARSLAFDLFGTPEAMRRGLPGEEIDRDGRVIALGQDVVGTARAEVARLVARRDELLPLDAFDRSTAEAGLTEDLGVAGRRLRSYEAALVRRLRWCLDLLDEAPGQVAPRPTPPPLVEDPPADPAPPLPPSAEEAGRKALLDIPLTPPPTSDRLDRRARKAEKRRAAAERKRDRRLGYGG